MNQVFKLVESSSTGNFFLHPLGGEPSNELQQIYLSLGETQHSKCLNVVYLTTLFTEAQQRHLWGSRPFFLSPMQESV